MSKSDMQPGERFGRLTVLREGGRHWQPNGKSVRRFWCQCSCGQTVLVLLQSLRNGSSVSCGCLRNEQNAERARSPEQRARMSAIGRSPEYAAARAVHANSPENRARLAALARSPEGRARSSQAASSPERLAKLAEFTRSPENRHRVSEQWRQHGLSSHPLYHAHQSMLARCHNPEHPTFADYGALGVTVTPEWHDPAAFITWIEANLGPRPGGITVGGMPEYSLDRIDPLGSYEPGNVRWATWSEQNRNRRRCAEACDE